MGVAIDSLLADMEVTLMKDIPLDKVSTSVTINAPASGLMLLHQLCRREAGCRGDKLSGTVRNTCPDILKEYAARGTYIFPPEPSMRLVTDTFAYCADGDATLEHHLDQRIPHQRSGRDADAGLAPLPWQTAWPTSKRRSSGARNRRLRPAAERFFFNCKRWSSSRRSASSAPPARCGPR